MQVVQQNKLTSRHAILAYLANQKLTWCNTSSGHWKWKSSHRHFASPESRSYKTPTAETLLEKPAGERVSGRANRQAGGISAERRNWKRPRPPLWNSEAWRSSRRVPTVICLTNSRQPAGHIFFIKRANVCVLTQHLWSGCGGVPSQCCWTFFLLFFQKKKFFNKPNCVHKGGSCLLMLCIKKTTPPFFFLLDE